MKNYITTLLILISITAFSQTTIKVNERRIEQRIFELAKLVKTAAAEVTGLLLQKVIRKEEPGLSG